MVKYYSMRNLATHKYSILLEFPDDYSAKHAFVSYFKKNPDSQLAIKPTDFQLDQVGFFDEETGIFQNEKREVGGMYTIIKEALMESQIQSHQSQGVNSNERS